MYRCQEAVGLPGAEGTIQMRGETLRREHDDVRQRVLNVCWGACAPPSPPYTQPQTNLSKIGLFLHSFAYVCCGSHYLSYLEARKPAGKLK